MEIGEKDSIQNLKILLLIYLPAVWIVIETRNGAITTGKTHIVETGYCQTTVYSNIYKILLLPSLHKYIYKLYMRTEKLL